MRWKKRAKDLERAIRNHLDHSDCTANMVLRSVLAQVPKERNTARVFRGRKAIIRWKTTDLLQPILEIFKGKSSIIEVWIEEETEHCYRISTGAWVWQRGEWFSKETIEIVDWL